MKRLLFCSMLAISVTILILLTAFKTPTSDHKKGFTSLAYLHTFPVLCMSKEDFKNLLKRIPGEDNVKKLVLIFNTDDSKPDNPTLAVFRSRNNAKFLAKIPSYILKRTSKLESISGEYYMNNLELTSKLIDVIQKHTQFATANSILFYPIKGTDKHIYYEIFLWDEDCSNTPPEKNQLLKNKISLIGKVGDLNPSPPYDPEQ